MADWYIRCVGDIELAGSHVVDSRDKWMVLTDAHDVGVVATNGSRPHLRSAAKLGKVRVNPDHMILMVEIEPLKWDDDEAVMVPRSEETK